MLVDIFAIVCAGFPMVDNRLQPARQRQLAGSDRAADAAALSGDRTSCGDQIALGLEWKPVQLPHGNLSCRGRVRIWPAFTKRTASILVGTKTESRSA